MVTIDEQIRLARGEAGIGKERGRVKRAVLAREKATETQWMLVEMAVKAFAQKYPVQWNAFIIDMKNRKDGFQIEGNKYGISRDKTLKKVDWRLSCSFPVIVNAQGEIVDDLQPVLEKIIPALTHTKSVNFQKFLKKFPMFSPTYASNAGTY